MPECRPICITIRILSQRWSSASRMPSWIAQARPRTVPAWFLHPESRTAVQALIQRSARLKLAVDVVHELVAADVRQAPSFEQPCRCVGERLKKIRPVAQR